MIMKIQGGHRLHGRVHINGSKNAFLPLIAATVLVKGRVVFKQAPRLTDTDRLLEILVDMGAKVEWLGEHEVAIDSTNLDPKRLDRKKMKRLRGSILLLGPMLARFKSIFVPEPGGCSIGNRPIDAHLQALEQLDAVCRPTDSDSLEMESKGLKGNYIVMSEFSVTATENIVMAAVMAKGHTSIRLAAAEPHVQDVCKFLNACGAKIRGVGGHDLEIDGVKSLKAPKRPWTVSSDVIEIGTFAVAAALTRGDVTMSPVNPAHLDSLCMNLSKIGIKYELGKTALRVHGTSKLNAFKLQALIYPGFPTDLQALFGLVATQAQGTSLIQDPLFEGRMGYVNELIKMGANAVVADPHRVIISGPTPLRGTEIRSLDLRAGATMVLAGLIAEGETTIHDAEMVYRGYEQLDQRLIDLGARIQIDPS